MNRSKLFSSAFIALLVSGCGDKAPDCGDPVVIEQVKAKLVEQSRTLMIAAAKQIGGSTWSGVLESTGLVVKSVMKLSLVETLMLEESGKVPYTWEFDAKQIDVVVSNPRLEEKKSDAPKNICAATLKIQGAVFGTLNISELVNLAMKGAATVPVDAAVMSDLDKIESGTESKKPTVEQKPKTKDDIPVLQTYWSDIQHTLVASKLTSSANFEFSQEKNTVTQKLEPAGGEVTFKYSAQKGADGNLIVEIIDDKK